MNFRSTRAKRNICVDFGVEFARAMRKHVQLWWPKQFASNMREDDMEFRAHCCTRNGKFVKIIVEENNGATDLTGNVHT